MRKPKFTRPTLNQALTVWKECLAGHGHPSELIWIFAENLCLEADGGQPNGFRVGYQTQFTPPDPDALEIAYDLFCDTDARIVFYRLGSAGKKSVCILLCDPWFEERQARDGFVRHDEWKISLRPGPAGEIKEVTDLTRWVRRVKRDRTLRDCDFAMALATIDEIKLHGRPLLPYERMAGKMLGRLRQKLGQPD